jgi:type IV secretion system protein VirD4
VPGQRTIRFETQGSSSSDQGITKPDSTSACVGEEVQRRHLLKADEVMRLGAARPIVLVAGEPPFLLDRIRYRASSCDQAAQQ